MTSQSKLTVYTFQMLDCYGDNFTYSVKASTEKEARSIAEMSCDDAITGKLLKQVKQLPQPVVREPLTPEQIKDEASHHGFIGSTEMLVKFVRGIEAHHGIKGGQHGAE